MIQAGGCGFDVIEEDGLVLLDLQGFRESLASDGPRKVVADDCVVHDGAGDAESGGFEFA
jgi:hypothetical protein